MERILSEVSPEVKTRLGKGGDGEHCGKNLLNETAGGGSYGDWMPGGAAGEGPLGDSGDEPPANIGSGFRAEGGTGGGLWASGASPGGAGTDVGRAPGSGATAAKGAVTPQSVS